MVNYRVKENYYIVDRLFNQAELRIAQEGGEEIVLIMVTIQLLKIIET